LKGTASSHDEAGTASGGAGGLHAGAPAEGMGTVQGAAREEDKEEGEESFTVWQRVFLVTAEQPGAS